MERNDNTNTNQGKHDKTYPYPRGIPFIISTEFCERFSYYGMKSNLNSTFIKWLHQKNFKANFGHVHFHKPYLFISAILSLYFVQVLNYTEDQATMLYSGFNFLCYFTPIIGSIIADSFFGKFKTIFYLAIVYAIGEVILTIASIGDTNNGNEGIPGLPVT